MHSRNIISINIPVRKNGSVARVIRSLRKINYPHKLVEIIISRGNHIAKQRNLAIRKSKGEIVYLLDDDSEVNERALAIIQQEFKKAKTAAVGGPSLAKKNKNYLNFLIGCALETYFGAMRMRFRYSSQNSKKEGTEYQLIGANLALRKKVVKRLGMFNEKIVPNEETELLRRIRKIGYKLVYKKELFIYRGHRKSLLDLARQFQHYGVGRAKQIIFNGSLEDLIFVLPIGFLFYLPALFFVNSSWFFIPLVLYFCLSLITSLKATIKYRKISLLVSLPLIFFVIHLSYAAGLIYEFFVKFRGENRKRKPEKIKIEVYNLDQLSNKSNLSGKSKLTPHL